MPYIKTIKGKSPGKTIAIFSGIHGNEKAGILAVQKLKETLSIQSGTVHLIEVNIPAIEKNARMINKNMNRLFIRDGQKTEATYEDSLAGELMTLLDDCDALLDLHSYNDSIENRTVFAITENNCLDLVKTLEVEKIITGFTDMQKGGTDGYMNARGKIGVCVELGSVNISEEMSEKGVLIAKQFLAYFDMLKTPEVATQNPVVLDAKMMYRKNTDDFAFDKAYKTFDAIPANTPFAKDGPITLSTEKDSVILFPQEKYDIGVEAFILAEEVGHNA